MKRNDLGEHRIIVPTDTLEYGIYIALSDKTIISPKDYAKGMSTEGVVLHTAHASCVIAKFDHPEKVTYDEAVRIGVFSRHEAIEHDLHRKEISDALILIGGEPLNDMGYWLSEATEFSTSSAWFYGGSSGGLYYNTKRTNYFVRAVSALKDFLPSV